LCIVTQEPIYDIINGIRRELGECIVTTYREHRKAIDKPYIVNGWLLLNNDNKTIQLISGSLHVLKLRRWNLRDMVDKIFYIKGENIFNIGFRPALKSAGSQVGIKVHATNIHTDKQVRIIASGVYDSVMAFYNQVKDNDLRLFQDQPPKYDVTDIQDYKGVDIDWNGYNTEYISEQLSNSIIFYNKFFEHITKKLDSIENKISKSET
jgi:acylphosphatase